MIDEYRIQAVGDAKPYANIYDMNIMDQKISRYKGALYQWK